MSWVRPDGWLTYLTLDAASSSVTYDMGVSARGVIRIAPYGTTPMAVVDGVANGMPSWLPNLPLGTPEVVLLVLILAGVLGLLLWLFRGKKPAQSAAQASK
jgi:hypothetical protein